MTENTNGIFISVFFSSARDADDSITESGFYGVNAGKHDFPSKNELDEIIFEAIIIRTVAAMHDRMKWITWIRF